MMVVIVYPTKEPILMDQVMIQQLYVIQMVNGLIVMEILVGVVNVVFLGFLLEMEVLVNIVLKIMVLLHVVEMMQEKIIVQVVQLMVLICVVLYHQIV
jgi:hypothetical protein